MIRRGRARVTRALVALASALLARPERAVGQLRPQFRADALIGNAVAAHAGVGAEFDAGLYARVAFVGALGAVRLDGGPTGLGGRAEMALRFLLDPLAQSSVGVYLAGGVGARRDRREPWRGYLLGVVGAEGRARGGWTPALEVGAGGGARVGVALRRARPNRR